MTAGPFARYWTAATISSFGTAVTAVAMPVLVVRTLGASSFEVGAVSAAQVAPYAVLGLLAGVYVDRWRRRPVLVWSSIGRAATLGAVPLLWSLGALQVWTLVVLLVGYGACSVFGFAATQSLLPRLVPTSELVAANARIDQADAAAQTLGPALGGGLVGVLGAPVAIVIDAVSYLVDAALNAGLRVEEPRSAGSESRSLRREIGEGLRWMYRHPTLGPLAVSTHTWFLGNSAAFVALAVIALRTLDLSALTYQPAPDLERPRRLGGRAHRAAGRATVGLACSHRRRTRGLSGRMAPRRLDADLDGRHGSALPRTRPARTGDGRLERQRDGLLAVTHTGSPARQSERLQAVDEPNHGDRRITRGWARAGCHR